MVSITQKFDDILKQKRHFKPLLQNNMITFLSIYNIGEKCNYCEHKEMLTASKKHSKFLLISERIDPDLNRQKIMGKDL